MPDSLPFKYSINLPYNQSIQHSSHCKMAVGDDNVSMVSTIQETMPSPSTSPPARQYVDWGT